MASISRPGRATEPRSGGKIVRSRRSATAFRPRTPYERPPNPSLPDSGRGNPNWISRLILSPTRLIATGAGKVLASVFGPESPSSSSSSSSSDDDAGSSSEGDTDDETDMSSQSVDEMEKNNQKSEMGNSLRKEPEDVEWNSETKRVIARLLMQETFSREEGDKLTHIISSRVIDSPLAGGEAKEGRLTLKNDVDMPDLRSAAVTEAKKWLEEKKLGSNSKSELDYGTCSLNTAMLPHDTEGEVGSLVDVAKSYMLARPPWTSSSISQIEFKSPSPIAIQPYKEVTPYLFGANSLSSFKLNRDSPATGSWNIMDEIRKVRSKATEEMLRTPSSSQINWSSVALDYKGSPESLVIDKGVAGMEDKMLASSQSTNTHWNLVCGIAANGLAVSQIRKDGLQNNAVQANPAVSVPGSSQDLGATPINKGDQEGTISHGHRLQVSVDSKDASQSDAAAADPMDADYGSQALGSMVGETIQDAVLVSRSKETNGSPSTRVAGRDDKVAANGFPSSGSSLLAGQEQERKSRSSDELKNPVDSTHDGSIAPVDETHNLLSEASIEVRIVDENDIEATNSQNSSSMQHNELLQDLARPNLKRKTTVRKITGVAEKQQGRKPSRVSRRVRGRGK